MVSSVAGTKICPRAAPFSTQSVGAWGRGTNTPAEGAATSISSQSFSQTSRGYRRCCRRLTMPEGISNVAGPSLVSLDQRFRIVTDESSSGVAQAYRRTEWHSVERRQMPPLPRSATPCYSRTHSPGAGRRCESYRGSNRIASRSSSASSIWLPSADGPAPEPRLSSCCSTMIGPSPAVKRPRQALSGKSASPGTS